MRIKFMLFILLLSVKLMGQQNDTSVSIKNDINKNFKEVESLKNELKDVKSQLDNYNQLLNGALIVFTVLIAVGSGFSIFSLVRNENRESKAFKIAMDSYQESRAESGSVKERENLQFNESQKTLTLVNETLTLATEATKRASKALENRLKDSLEKLEKASTKLIQDSQAFIDDKNLTTDTDICSEIHRIGRKIEGLENNLVILGDNLISLKPYCNFIRAADSYLNEQFDQALDYIDEVIFSTDSEQKLKSLAYYWKGYIQNNLGEFNKAASDFKNAYDLATDSRRYELRRIELETKFFNNEKFETILQEFDSLSKQIEEDESSESKAIIESRKAKIKTTVGNIFYQIAMETIEDESKKRFLQRSIDCFAELLRINLADTASIFNTLSLHSEKEKLKWTIFGLAESMYQNDYKREEATQIFKDIVYYSAENEFLNREEKRTKVLAKTTQLICDIRSGESEIKISQTKSLVESALSSVDKRLTIYSQMQRRNVSRQTFRDDIVRLIRNE